MCKIVAHGFPDETFIMKMYFENKLMTKVKGVQWHVMCVPMIIATNKLLYYENLANLSNKYHMT